METAETGGGTNRLSPAPGRVVLDTNVWLDWLVFANASVQPLRAAVARGDWVVLIDAAGLAELARVLAYPLQRWTLDAARQDACLAECLSLAQQVEVRAHSGLPRCRDPDDQKFLELAAGAGADLLLTRDAALLAMNGRRGLPFRILTPAACVLSAGVECAAAPATRVQTGGPAWT